jgi:glucose-1-phosphate thymidylyltransferase
MKIIIPMAGMGKRMRPHTLSVPKPLIKVAGKPIVQRLAEDISKVCTEKVDEIAFIIGDFGTEVENTLTQIAHKLGAKASIYYQEEALGTGHAILCAKESLQGKVIVAFADTLFRADFKMNENQDGIIWVQKIDDPSAFGVVKVNESGHISDFLEKPKNFVSDLAIIGIYYFKDGENLKNELQYLIDNSVIKSGEYQLTDALENMKNKGIKFSPGQVVEWLDCGNKNATVNTNQRVLAFEDKNTLVHPSAKNIDSKIIEPCFIGEGVSIENSVVGPYVSLGNNTRVVSSVIKNSIVQESTDVKNAIIENAMIGCNATVHGKALDLSISDYSTIA